MKKTLSGRHEYTNKAGAQKRKDETILYSNEKELKVISILKKTNLFYKVEKFQPTNYLGGAPAVKITSKGEELVIAPDIQCFVNAKKFFWVDVKDKPQRFFYPDTGCDFHQYLSYYKINKYAHQAILLFFIDPPLSKIQLQFPEYLGEQRKRSFLERWHRFAPNGKPSYYGNWLAILSEYSSELGYPQCSHEHTRNQKMDIIYMHVDKMVSFYGKEIFHKLLMNYDKHENIPDFKIKDYEKGIVTDISVYDYRIQKYLRSS